MKRPLLILLFIEIISSCSNLLTAQWIQASGPEGGETYCFSSIDSRLFAGTWRSGVFLSTNSGVNWTINTRNATFNISATGLPDKTIIVTQEGSPTGIDNTLPDANINVYPNPTTGITTIVYPKGKNVVVKLLDTSGYLVKQVTDNDQDGETVVYLSRYPSGIIYCQVQVFDGTIANLKVLSGKIVVQ
jgi:hypothetical protein